MQTELDWTFASLVLLFFSVKHLQIHKWLLWRVRRGKQLVLIRLVLRLIKRILVFFWLQAKRAHREAAVIKFLHENIFRGYISIWWVGHALRDEHEMSKWLHPAVFREGGPLESHSLLGSVSVVVLRKHFVFDFDWNYKQKLTHLLHGVLGFWGFGVNYARSGERDG